MLKQRLKKRAHDQHSHVLSLPQAYLCRLRAERRRAEERGRASTQGDQRRRVGVLVKGIDRLLETIASDAPWKVAWPRDKPLELSALMAEAVLAKCPLSVAFLHRAGAWAFRSGEWGASALAAALEGEHKGMDELLIKHLGSSVYADARLLSGGISTSLREVSPRPRHRDGLRQRQIARPGSTDILKP